MKKDPHEAPYLVATGSSYLHGFCPHGTDSSISIQSAYNTDEDVRVGRNSHFARAYCSYDADDDVRATEFSNEYTAHILRAPTFQPPSYRTFHQCVRFSPRDFQLQHKRHNTYCYV